MTEEKKPASKKSKKQASPKKEATKPAAEKPVLKAESKTSKKNILSEGDLVKNKEGKEYIFIRPSRKERVVLKEKDSDIEVVIDKDLLVK
jgi:uncharacterized protein YdeI (BOF family)